MVARRAMDEQRPNEVARQNLRFPDQAPDRIRPPQAPWAVHQWKLHAGESAGACVLRQAAHSPALLAAADSRW